MYMNKIETLARRSQGPGHLGRPVQPPQNAAREIGHFHALQIHRLPERNGAVVRTIDIGCEYMDIVAAGSQLAAKRMH